MQGLKAFTPHKLKAARQVLLLRRAEAITGLRGGFPVPQSNSTEQIAYVIGSGASILDFDLKERELRKSVSITLNNSIFLPFSPKFHSYEGSKRPVELEKKLRRVLVGSEINVLCRIPVNLKSLLDYPEAILHRPKNSHLFTSVDALSEGQFDQQLRYYLSDKVHQLSPGLDPGFSLGRIIIRLLKLGYKDIRLLGIDLFSAEHFWHSSQSHTWLLKLYGSEDKSTHNTALEADFRAWTAPAFLIRMHNLEDRFGYRITTDSQSGSARILPPFNAKN